MARPKCPNHGVEMIGTDERRIFICPVSDARFECDVDENAKGGGLRLNTAGQLEHSWKIKNIDEE